MRRAAGALAVMVALLHPVLAAAGGPAGSRESAPSLVLTGTGGGAVGTGQSYALMFQVDDVDGNLASVEVNWNDGTPLESKPVSGGQTSVTFTRAFATARTIRWSATARDSAANASPAVSDVFSVFAVSIGRIDGEAFRDTGSVLETELVFLTRLGGGAIDPAARTWIVIHGRDNSSTTFAIAELANAVATARAPALEQVLLLDWGPAAGKFLTVPEVWIEPVAQWAAAVLASVGFEGVDLNLIGHSYGSYVAVELGERIPFSALAGANGVAAVVGLDPAADFPGGGYPIEAADFGSASGCSWAFHSSDLWGSEQTPTTAAEALVVNFVGEDELDRHGLIRGLFSSMVIDPEGEVARFFQLNRLVSCGAGPWMPNQFTSGGVAQAGQPYEAVITVSSSGISIQYAALPAPTLALSSTSGATVTAGVPYSIVVDAADADGNLAAVVLDWNDGTPAEVRAVSGTGESVTFTRTFRAVATINWFATAYDSTFGVSNLVQGAFSVTAVPPPVDLDADGNGDALTYAPGNGSWARLLSQAGGGFAQENQGTWAAGWTVVPAAFDADAQTDFFLFNTVTGQWMKVLSDGTGFTEQAAGDWWPGWERYVMDLDGDEISDLFLSDPVTGQWFRCVSTPTGFTYTQGGWNPGWELYPMTLNEDAYGDLFLINRSTGRWFWAVGDGAEGFNYPATETWFPEWALHPGDFNGDGVSDLLLHHAATGQYFVAFTTGTGFVYVQGGWSLGWTPWVADLNGDGTSDLFLHDAATGAWFQMFSDGLGAFTNVGGQIWSLGWELFPTDFNADGRTDFLLYSAETGVWFQARNLTNGVFTYSSGTWSPGLAIVARAPAR